MSSDLSPNAASVLSAVRSARAPISTEAVRQAAGLDYASSLDAFAELLDAGLVEVVGDDSLDAVFLKMTQGAA